MTQDYPKPIAPPPELVQQWDVEGRHQDYCTVASHIAARAAQWGADQELEACCQWMSNRSSLTEQLRAARRPKPPSLKQQALEELEQLRGDASSMGMGFDAPAIRRALEQIDD
jgi:hypothetical protein